MLMASGLNALIPDKQARIVILGIQAELFTRSESWSDRCQGFSQCIANATSIETTNPRFLCGEEAGAEKLLGL